MFEIGTEVKLFGLQAENAVYNGDLAKVISLKDENGHYTVQLKHSLTKISVEEDNMTFKIRVALKSSAAYDNHSGSDRLGYETPDSALGLR